ncbi:hypothetical protein KEM52_001762 [Ascosphaera acerosa]|nr:hypothetical protein KEM52_001762 [Ascosphaera acerosa]
MEELESYLVRWIYVQPKHTIAWSIQPHRKSLNFGIFKHPFTQPPPSPSPSPSPSPCSSVSVVEQRRRCRSEKGPWVATTMNRYRNAPGNRAAPARATATTQCQKCLKRDMSPARPTAALHYLVCPNTPY